MDMPELVDMVEVEPLDGYRLRLVFEDGKRGILMSLPIWASASFASSRNSC